jgi:hypothetical protein
MDRRSASEDGAKRERARRRVMKLRRERLATAHGESPSTPPRDEVGEAPPSTLRSAELPQAPSD